MNWTGFVASENVSGEEGRKRDDRIKGEVRTGGEGREKKGRGT